MFLMYGLIFVILLALEVIYFRIADCFNIIDKPNQRSSHSTIVLRGGGIIFLLGLWVWEAFASAGLIGAGTGLQYPWMLAAVTIAAGVSFVDDIRSLPDSVRLVAQFMAMALMIVELYLGARGIGLFGDTNVLVLSVLMLASLVVCVGATNVYNFMDGINGITAGYSGVVLLSVLMADAQLGVSIDRSLCCVMLLAVAVFAIFNFRPRGKAKCFAGDVGSVGIALILLFMIGQVIVQTGDITWLIFLLVYGVDGCLTIVHRIMLHENLGEAHRKHAYQLMANELGLSHVAVSLVYMGLQLAVSVGFVWGCGALAQYLGFPLPLVHWVYLICAFALLSLAYVLFMRKYYHLHEEYLAELGK